MSTDQNHAFGEEEDRMTEALMKLKKVHIPDRQLEKLGMDKKWADTVSPKYVSCVLGVADRHKALFKELSKK